jgi:hypothetical protein
MIGISQASMNPDTVQALTPPTTTALPAKTVTKKGPAPVNYQIPRVPKPKLFRSNPLRKSLILGGSNPWDTVDDEDYIVNSYRRLIELKKYNEKDQDDLPEYIRWRLFLARQLAMLRYKELYTNIKS